MPETPTSHPTVTIRVATRNDAEAMRRTVGADTAATVTDPPRHLRPVDRCATGVRRVEEHEEVVAEPVELLEDHATTAVMSPRRTPSRPGVHGDG